MVEVTPNLLVTQHYFDRFYQIRPEHLTDKQAYYALEDEVSEQTQGRNKYSSYEAFKVMRSRYLIKLAAKK